MTAPALRVRFDSMKFFDRLLTIIITATLTSAVWIVFGTAIMKAAEAEGSPEATASDEAVSEETPEVEQTAPAKPETAASENLQSTVASTRADGSPENAQSKPALAMPVQGVAVSALQDSFFDPRGPNDDRVHEAIDIMAPRGTLVMAAAPGRVAKIHRSKAGGNSVYIRSSDQTRLYFYAHLAAYAEGLEEGAKVQAGTQIGTVGTSGNAVPDAPHLHFAVFETTRDAEWWEPANAINPYPLLTQPAS